MIPQRHLVCGDVLHAGEFIIESAAAAARRVPQQAFAFPFTPRGRTVGSGFRLVNVFIIGIERPLIITDALGRGVVRRIGDRIGIIERRVIGGDSVSSGIGAIRVTGAGSRVNGIDGCFGRRHVCGAFEPPIRVFSFEKRILLDFLLDIIS